MKKLLKFLSLALLLSSTLDLKSSEKTTIGLGLHLDLETGHKISFINPDTEIREFISTESKTNRAILQEIAVIAGLPVANIRLALGGKKIKLNNDRIFDYELLDHLC